MMTAPGIGPSAIAYRDCSAFTALSYASKVEDPGNFKSSRTVGAYVGLTARRYQSGEIDYDGHNSKRGGKHVRALLYEAAIWCRPASDRSARRADGV